MKVSIRTAYRIVKKTEDPESDPIFVPQYQEEGDPPTTFHNFRAFKSGRSGGHNDIYFSNLEDAIICVRASQAIEDKVVWRCGTDNY